ncbi:hypothetical protein SAMN05192563_103029 [Paraburkholderia aspalathi]|uniref:Uncharacterized protein n=1 Tax=Paraburkholderia aspalathi TaxID=1324617 RepID=A0A1I7ELM6_9BURK|nr:hypothetical protein SAMN05192563_103029 [Paraburkholderia aspalathi]
MRTKFPPESRCVFASAKTDTASAISHQAPAWAFMRVPGYPNDDLIGPRSAVWSISDFSLPQSARALVGVIVRIVQILAVRTKNIQKSMTCMGRGSETSKSRQILMGQASVPCNRQIRHGKYEITPIWRMYSTLSASVALRASVPPLTSSPSGPH